MGTITDKAWEESEQHYRETINKNKMEKLHPHSIGLLEYCFRQLEAKMIRNQEKYGYTNEWLINDWEDECRLHMRQHMEKGDPRDVAIYAMFMMFRGWSTSTIGPIKQSGKRPPALYIADKYIGKIPNPNSKLSKDRSWDGIRLAFARDIETYFLSYDADSREEIEKLRVENKSLTKGVIAHREDLEKFKEENAKLREALEWYANSKNYVFSESRITPEFARVMEMRAKEVLKGGSDE